MLERKETILLAAATVILASVALIFGYTGYAQYGYHDSIYTMPAAVSFASGQGLKNPVTALNNLAADPTGQNRFLFYPPLFPIFVGTLISKSIPLPYPQQALFFGGIINAFVLVLSSFVFYKIATLGGKKLDFFGVALISVVLLIMLRTSYTVIARPEILEGLFLLFGFLLAFYLRRPRQVITGFAIVLGFMAATHFFGAIFFALLIGLYFSFFYEWRRGAVYAAATYLLAIPMFLLVMQVSPYSVLDAVKGVFRHAYANPQKFDLINSAHVFFANQYSVAFLIMMALWTIFYLRLCFNYRREIKSFFFFLVFSACIALAAMILVINGIRTYYALLISVFVFAVLIYYLLQIASTSRMKHLALLFIILPVAAFSLKPMIIFPSFASRGVSIKTARDKFQEIIANHPGAKFYVGTNLWILSDDYERMRYDGDFSAEDKINHPLVVIDQSSSYQNYNPLVTPIPPKEVEGCPLEENYFATEIPEIFSIKLASAMPGYGFAVYNCK